VFAHISSDTSSFYLMQLSIASAAAAAGDHDESLQGAMINQIRVALTVRHVREPQELTVTTPHQQKKRMDDSDRSGYAPIRTSVGA
jgi:hypothetical protein